MGDGLSMARVMEFHKPSFPNIRKYLNTLSPPKISERIIAPIGTPPPRPFARVIISGSIW